MLPLFNYQKSITSFTLSFYFIFFEEKAKKKKNEREEKIQLYKDMYVKEYSEVRNYSGRRTSSLLFPKPLTPQLLREEAHTQTIMIRRKSREPAQCA